MPELPEVDAICEVIRRHAEGNVIRCVQVLRQNGRYLIDLLGFQRERALDLPVRRVGRVGKRVLFHFGHGKPYLVAHNAMTGYFDWEHEPWSFDYVEGARDPLNSSDVRVRFTFADGKVLRFHDARMFGSIYCDTSVPSTAPELIETPNAWPGLRVITLWQFAEGILRASAPIKHLLMDQSFVMGVGNIYANEACNVAGLAPGTPARLVNPASIPLLLEALRCVVAHSIPRVRYDWLSVYRRSTCGACNSPVQRSQLRGRSTFWCLRCQG